MLKERYVNTLKPGDVFRDWLIDLIGDKIQDKSCPVPVYKIEPTSHTVCRYEFKDEGYSVMAKFFSEPTGWKRDYDPRETLKIESRNLKRVERVISVPKLLAANEEFNCVLVTEYLHGTPLYVYMRSENGLYDRLTSVAGILRALHDNTRTSYRKQDEFAHFHRTLDQLGLGSKDRETFNRLLGDWWNSTLINRRYGCLIHHDANPVNYIFDNEKAYALDFESARDNANPVHDLGIMAAELKHYFAVHKHNGELAEPYIGHFLWRYSKSLDEFKRITRVLPFFMSLGLLRMNRLRIDPDNGAYIFKEALACLRYVSSDS